MFKTATTLRKDGQPRYGNNRRNIRVAGNGALASQNTSMTLSVDDGTVVALCLDAHAYKGSQTGGSGLAAELGVAAENSTLIKVKGDFR